MGLLGLLGCVGGRRRYVDADEGGANRKNKEKKQKHTRREKKKVKKQKNKKRKEEKIKNEAVIKTATQPESP